MGMIMVANKKATYLLISLLDFNDAKIQYINKHTRIAKIPVMNSLKIPLPNKN